jgi:hypothetical protein
MGRISVWFLVFGFWISIQNGVYAVDNFFDNRLPFQIISLKKDIKYTSEKSDLLLCSNWNVSNQDIIKVIQNSNQINSHIVHYEFDNLPCVYVGKITQNYVEYKVEVNAGSWFSVSNKDTTLFFGSYLDENKKYFLSYVWKEPLVDDYLLHKNWYSCDENVFNSEKINQLKFSSSKHYCKDSSYNYWVFEKNNNMYFTHASDHLFYSDGVFTPSEWGLNNDTLVVGKNIFKIITISTTELIIQKIDVIYIPYFFSKSSSKTTIEILKRDYNLRLLNIGDFISKKLIENDSIVYNKCKDKFGVDVFEKATVSADSLDNIGEGYKSASFNIKQLKKDVQDIFSTIPLDSLRANLYCVVLDINSKGEIVSFTPKKIINFSEVYDAYFENLVSKLIPKIVVAHSASFKGVPENSKETIVISYFFH